METITKTTAMVMAAGLLMAAPACGEQLAKSMTVQVPSAPLDTTEETVPAPSAPLDTSEETVPTLAPMLPAPEVVQRFIDHGVTHKNDNHALVLRDSQQGWANFAVAMTTPKYRTPAGVKTGLWIEVFTPLSWVTQKAAAATREYRKFTLANVTPELMEPVVRVIAHPDLPVYLTASGKAGTRSVQHVVMQDASQTITVQPVMTEPYDVPVKNAMGAEEVYAGLTAVFPLDQVLALRAKGEFYIVVVGTQGEKRYKVKTKHFAQLPLMPHMPAHEAEVQQSEVVPCERPPGGIWPRQKGVRYCR